MTLETSEPRPARQPRPARTSEQIHAEEVANAITHGLGWLLSAIAAVVLIVAAARVGSTRYLIGSVIYAASMVAVYGASTLSHVFHATSRRRLFRVLDQAFIYLYIAGTFTPVALVYLRGGRWWMLLLAMWIIALAGFASKAFFAHRVEGISTVLYVFLGWLPALCAFQMTPLIPGAVLMWMLAGGLCYTVGVLVLTLDERIPFFHAAWHLFVIAGSACHYIAIAVHVRP